MTENRQQRGRPEPDSEPARTDPRDIIPHDDKPSQEMEREQEDSFQGDRDVLDEDSPLDFQVEELGRTVADPLEEDPAQNYRINQAEIEDDAERIGHYTEDAEVIEDFVLRQKMGDSAGEHIKKLEQYHGVSPKTSADDVDAAWEKAIQSGEESVGGSNPTPDQDIVEEIGEAAGLTYRDDEPLDYSKVEDRDRHRWELDPASAEDSDDELESLDALDGEEDLEGLEDIPVIDNNDQEMEEDEDEY